LSRDNVTALYGADPASRLADPGDPTKVFSWHICRSWEDKGNAASYGYAAEDSAGIDQAAAHEANRTTQARATQIYLKTIRYGNLQPYIPDWTAQEETALPADWMFAVVRPVRGQGDDGPRAALRQRRAVRSATDPAGRYRRIGHRRPAVRGRGWRDRLVQPVGQRLVSADAHRGVPSRGPAGHGPGDRPAGQFALLRQGHEIQLQQMVENVRYLQWQHAQETTNGC